ncbi:MAG: tyrosine-type recombinase/integrase [Candidatus Kuenenia sp.]|nr:tyrosine-type recombinase/integrase [Candidatus Kuenenia hertensis]
MAIRWRKYHKKCKGKRNEGDRYGKVVEKGIECEGKRGKNCPEGVPSPCGAWSIDYREIDGRWVSKVFPGISKTEAKERLEDIRSNIRRGLIGLPQTRKIPTLKEYTEKYLELSGNDKENTRLAKQRAVKVLVKYLGDYKLDKITPFIIEKFRIERQDKDSVKPSAINMDTAFLSNMFNVAIKQGILDKNPCQNVKRLKVAQMKDRILSQEEISLLLDKLQGKDRLMVLIGLFTGLRLGGILSLSWTDIDFNKGLIHSNHKTGKMVSIPISDYLSGELRKWKEINSGSRLFVEGKVTQKVVARYSTHFSNLFKSLGIQDFTFHNLRHTFASILQGDLGIGAVVVQGMTGHSSLGMLQKYSHSGLDSKKTAIDALTEHILNATPEAVLSIAK